MLLQGGSSGRWLGGAGPACALCLRRQRQQQELGVQRASLCTHCDGRRSGAAHNRVHWVRGRLPSCSGCALSQSLSLLLPLSSSQRYTCLLQLCHSSTAFQPCVHCSSGQYGAHAADRGFNAIHISSAASVWVQQVGWLVASPCVAFVANVMRRRAGASQVQVANGTVTQRQLL